MPDAAYYRAWRLRNLATSRKHSIAYYWRNRDKIIEAKRSRRRNKSMSESHEISSPDALISDAKIARLNDLITKVVKWLEEADAFLTNDAEVTDSQRIANASIVINDALDNLAPYVEGLKS